jgi:hypothetical protein
MPLALLAVIIFVNRSNTNIQTFLPYADFDKTAAALDKSRLGNQVYREGKTLIMGGWPNHPASKMWANYKIALAEYCLACLRELTKRGRHYQKHIDFFTDIRNSGKLVMPHWFGNQDFHRSHQSNLIRKNPNHYKPIFGNVPDDLPYIWPI